MPRGKKFGKPTPQAASTTTGASSLPAEYMGHPVRLIQDRIRAIEKEIREVVDEIRREAAQRELFAPPQDVRKGDSTATGND